MIETQPMSPRRYRQYLMGVMLLFPLLCLGEFVRAVQSPDQPTTPLMVGVPFSPQLDHDALEAQSQAAIQWFNLPNGKCLYVTTYDGWTIAKPDLGLTLSAPCP